MKLPKPQFIKFKNLITPLFLITIIILGIYCSSGIFRYYFFKTHDSDAHIARSLDAIVAMEEDHFPLRWAGSLNYSCGVPIFNFFYPLFYYLVFIINLFTKNVIISLKVIYFLSFIIGPIFMFLWLKKETKDNWGAFIGALLYLFLPYRFLLIYVRNSPEFLAYMILPILLYQITCFCQRLKDEKKSLIAGFWVSISIALLIMAHNLVALITLPVVISWLIYKFWSFKLYRKKANFILILGIIFSAIGFSAFFWGPMIFEQDNTQLGTMGVYEYYHHFPTVRQLIRSPWGFYYSLVGSEDGMSFMLGYAQWFILGLTVVFLCFSLLKWGIRKTIKVNQELFFWLLFSGLFLFLMWARSQFVWELLTPLQRIQFPWRLLGVVGLTIAAVAGFWLAAVKNKKILFLLIPIILFLAIYGNRNHIKVQPVDNLEWYRQPDSHPLRYRTTTVGDDILNQAAVEACSPDDNFLLINNQVINNQISRGNTFGSVKFEWPKAETADMIKLNLEYFPGIYQINVNGKRVEKINNTLGRVNLEKIILNEGKNIIDWRIVQSPIEQRFNNISLGFLVFWLILIPVYEIKRRV